MRSHAAPSKPNWHSQRPVWGSQSPRSLQTALVPCTSPSKSGGGAFAAALRMPVVAAEDDRGAATPAAGLVQASPDGQVRNSHAGPSKCARSTPALQWQRL